jgi:putative hydrolase of the HAD superfamily
MTSMYEDRMGAAGGQNMSEPQGRGAARAVIIDWGGVLTNPLIETVRAWIAAEGIDWDSYVAVMRPWLLDSYSGNGTINPVHALERGECAVAEFEEILAARLTRVDGGAVVADGLLTRMLAAMRPVPAMYQLLRSLRGAGVRTVLLSNSWGEGGYARADFPGLFDAVVISSEVGMRKPEPRIFHHAAAALALPPAECVFIDDIEANVTAAIACGMTGVHHTDTDLTVERLAVLFPGLVLSGMADHPSGYPQPSSPGRSANMRAIRRTNTKPEVALRQALHQMGYRYRKDYRLDLQSGARVRPDIVFTARKVAVFVDGCFWHACPEHGSKPRVNEFYWAPKLLRNVERDRAADAALIIAGWKVVRLWEHVPLEDAVASVVAALGAGTASRDGAGDSQGPSPAE